MWLICLIICACCSSGLSVEPPEVIVPGSVTLVGLFAVRSSMNGECTSDIDINSVMLIEAVKWYINQLNKQGNLPLTIGFEAHATCRLTTRAADIAIDMVSRRRTNEPILGILGPEYSSEAMVISPILSSVSKDRRLFQVGFSSTVLSLNDRSKYPDYVRVIPNDDIQIESMIQTFKQLEWNRITIVYEADVFGEECAQLLEARAKEEDVCVSKTHSINITDGVNLEEVRSILDDIVLGTDDSPNVNGIVLFASSSIVNKVFMSMEKMQISPSPIVLMSESLNMNVNALRLSSWSSLAATQGSLAVSPPYREVAEFYDHWKKIFTDVSVFVEEFKSNPLLIEVHRALSNPCPSDNCAALDKTEVDYIFGTQPLYVQYALIAAHALIKGVTDAHQKYCTSAGGLCSNFTNNFRLTDLNDLEINFGSDFDWSPSSMPMSSMRFDVKGELIATNSEPLYTLLNYKKVQGSFDLVKVGEFNALGLSLNREDIRDYKNNGDEMSWPDLRKAQCPIKTKCGDCLQMKPDSILYEPGDYYVIAAVPVFNSDRMQGCGSIRTYPGYQAIEAIKKAIEEVNAQNELEESDLTIGFIILNTCSNAAVIQRKIYELHYSGVHLPNGTKLVLGVDKVIGYVGEVNSHVSIAMAEVLTKFPLIQISYASTSDELSDRDSFPNFMRLVSPIRLQGDAIIKIVNNIESDYVQILYSDTVYGRDGRDDTERVATDYNICVIQSIPFSVGDNPYEVYDKLRKYPHARIVIVFLHSFLIRDVMSSIVSQMRQGEFTFIGSQTWHHTSDLLDSDTYQILLGSFSLGLEIAGDSQLLQRVRNLSPRSSRLDPWVMPFLQERGNCYYNSSYDKTQPSNCHDLDKLQFVLDYLDTYAYFTTKSLLKGATSFLRKQCSTSKLSTCLSFAEHRQEFLDEMHRVKLDIDGSGMEDYVFDENGDGNVGFRIYNVQKEKFDPSKMVYTPVGRYSRDGTFVLEKNKLVYPTSDPFVSVCPNALACKVCHVTADEEVGDANGGNDKSTGDLPMILGIVSTVAVVIAAILVGVIIVIFRKYKALKFQLYKENTGGYINPVHIDVTDSSFEETPPSPHGLIQTTDS